MNKVTEGGSAISIDEVKMSEIVLQSAGQQQLLILSTIMLPLQVKGEAVTGLCSMEGGGGRRAQHNYAAAKSHQAVGPTPPAVGFTSHVEFLYHCTI
jgi:hypothetical protein